MENHIELSINEHFGSISDSGVEEALAAKRKIIATSELNIADNYLTYSDTHYSTHKEFLRDVTKHIMGQIDSCFEWIREEAAKDSGHVYMAYEDSRLWVANAKEQMGERVADITMGLGCVAKLFGIANRLATALHSGISPMTMVALGAMDSVNKFYGHKTWDPMVDPIGIILPRANTVNDFDDTIQIAKDAMTLLFFHEATHVCRAHLWMPKNVEGFKTHEVRRALEIDADWGAGRLFAEWGKKNRSSTDGEEDFKKNVVDRLMIASQCLYFAFQIYADNNTDEPHYHLPYTRAIANLRGAQSIWNEISSINDFDDLANVAYSRLAHIERLVPIVFKNWIKRSDVKTTKDLEEFENISNKILENKIITEQIVRMKMSPFMNA